MTALKLFWDHKLTSGWHDLNKVIQGRLFKTVVFKIYFSKFFIVLKQLKWLQSIEHTDKISLGLSNLSYEEFRTLLIELFMTQSLSLRFTCSGELNEKISLKLLINLKSGQS